MQGEPYVPGESTFDFFTWRDVHELRQRILAPYVGLVVEHINETIDAYGMYARYRIVCSEDEIWFVCLHDGIEDTCRVTQKTLSSNLCWDMNDPAGK